MPIDDFIKRYKNQQSDDNSSPSPDLGLQGKKLEVNFEPHGCISASAIATAKLPYNVSISLPYLDAKIGVDDIDGTIDDTTKIYSMAGSEEQNPAMSTTELVNLIKQVRRVPVERDTVYNEIKNYTDINATTDPVLN